MSKFQIIVLSLLGLMACVILAGIGMFSIYFLGLQDNQQAQVAQEPTNTPKPTPTPKTMYFCGIDRCRNSGLYGEMVFETGINVWNNPEPNRGGVHHQASHGDKVTVVNRKRAFIGSGGLWYALEGGGWTNDLWLTDEICTPANIRDYMLADC